MSTSMKRILLNHLNQLLHVKHHLSSLLQVCKLHPVWDPRPPALVSYCKEIERQLREIESGIYDIQLEFEIHSIKG